MVQGTCSVGDCPRPVIARGWCTKHYTRWKSTGDPLGIRKMGRRPGAVNLCSIHECDAPVAGHGWCRMHYARWRKYGDPLVTKRIIGDIDARFWSHVDRRGDDECWPWTSPTDTEGYGVFGVGQKVVKAMRWAYERYVGPIPEGFMPDHLCHDPAVCKLDNSCPHRLCVNYLRHLELVTNRENCLRGARTKVPDELAAALHARWQSGEKIEVLALEAGTHRANLYKRFKRITLAVPPSPEGMLF
jgi:HNH endonuclease